MGTSSATETAVKFGASELKANAALYQTHKRLIDAVAAKCDSPEDAIAIITSVAEVLRAQVNDGEGYTPPVEAGFGSNNAAQIAERILGLGTPDATIRKSFSDLGK